MFGLLLKGRGSWHRHSLAVFSALLLLSWSGRSLLLSDGEREINSSPGGLILDNWRQVFFSKSFGNRFHPPLVSDTTATVAGGQSDPEIGQDLSPDRCELQELESFAAAARIDRDFSKEVLFEERTLDLLPLPRAQFQILVPLSN